MIKGATNTRSFWLANPHRYSPEVLIILAPKPLRIAPRSMRRIVRSRISVGHNPPRLNRRYRRETLGSGMNRPIFRSQAAVPRPTDYAYPIPVVAVGVVVKLDADISIIVDRGRNEGSVRRCLLQRLASRISSCAPKGRGPTGGERELISCAGRPSEGSNCPGAWKHILGPPVGCGNGGYGGSGDFMILESVFFIEEDE